MRTLIMSALALLAGTAARAAPLEIFVLDAGGHRVVDAEVRVGDLTSTTSRGGRALFSDVPMGRHTVQIGERASEIEVGGHTVLDVVVTLNADRTMTIDVLVTDPAEAIPAAPQPSASTRAVALEVRDELDG